MEGAKPRLLVIGYPVLVEALLQGGAHTRRCPVRIGVGAGDAGQEGALRCRFRVLPQHTRRYGVLWSAENEQDTGVAVPTLARALSVGVCISIREAVDMRERACLHVHGQAVLEPYIQVRRKASIVMQMLQARSDATVRPLPGECCCPTWPRSTPRARTPSSQAPR